MKTVMEPITIQARISFAHIATPHQATPSSPLKFSGDFLVPPNSPDRSLIEQTGMGAATAWWAENASNVVAYAQTDARLRSFGDGSLKRNTRTGEPLVGYPGMYFVSANADVQPIIHKPSGEPIDPANTMEVNQYASAIYSGCWVNALIKPWKQDNTHGRTVRWELIAIQFVKDDEPFGDGRQPVDTRQYFGAVQQHPGPTGAGIAAPVAQQPPPVAPVAPVAPGQAPDPYLAPQQAPPQQPLAPQQAPNPYLAPQQAPPQQSLAPQQGPDGVWRDPTTGQPVAPPVMPGYPQ